MLSKVYGTIALMCLICASEVVESGMYITALVLISGMAIFAYLSMKEDGRIRHKKYTL